jgi:hypothetical protein
MKIISRTQGKVYSNMVTSSCTSHRYLLVLSVGEKPRGKSASSIFCVLLGTTYSSVCWDWGGGECRTLINYSKNSSAVGIIKISHNPNYMAYGREKAL